VDPQAALSPGEEAILETKILVVRGSPLNDVFEMAMKQRDSPMVPTGCFDMRARIATIPTRFWGNSTTRLDCTSFPGRSSG
jgi:hypothetical protein